ncbi:MAG: flagellar hook protein FlgE [Gemmatimonadota bacterium]|nr:flagellar hook protein FlgE [Gemmatimonadota bacterium]
MDRSLFSAVSGLRNNQTAMDVIGNNIANVNTTAFKASQANFTESFSQVLAGAARPTATSGGVNGLSVGLGSQLSSIDTAYTQGNLQATGVPTNLAIQGNSLFVVAKGAQTMYTRDGNFKWDSNGNLVASNGSVVQGLMATNGVLSGSLTNISAPIGQTSPASATSTVSVAGNFNSQASVITAVDPHNPTPAELADPANAGSVVQNTLSVYDSLGTKHNLTLVAWKTSATTWDAKIDPTGLSYDNTKPYTFGPGAESSPAAAAPPWQFTFNPDGTVNTTSSNLPSVTFTPSNGGAAVSLKLNPGTGSTGVTSFSSANSAVLSYQNGYASGVLETVAVAPDGTVTGAFSNGTSQTLGQIALAAFNNPEGLDQAADSMYTVSANSGTPLVGYSGKDTTSTIASGNLEMSNVDLAQEFTNMIITQRGFEANGKMVTSSDQMLQTLIQMKQ